MRIALATVAFLLAGCHSSPVRPVLPPSIGESVSPASGKPVEEAKSSVAVPEWLLTECGLLENIKDNPSANDILTAKARDAEAYQTCRAKNILLIRIVKDAFNIK